MNDINEQPPVPDQPQQPISEQQPAPVVTPIPEPKQSKTRKRAILESLPLDVKEDMENFMRTKNPSSTHKYMKDKYGDQFPFLNTLFRTTYYQYFKKFNVSASKELALQIKTAEPPKEMLDVINSITDPSISLQDKKQALTALYDSCKTRIQLMEQRQSNFIDPALEALILANKKEQHSILRTISTLQEQLSKDADKDWLTEAEILVQIIVSAVKNTYKITHPDQTNYTVFMSTLKENLTNLMKTYKATKENIIKEQVKVS